MARKYGISSGKKVVAAAGTAVPLVATQLCVGYLVVKALASNTGKIFVGDSTVAAANGYELAAGQEIAIGNNMGDVGVMLDMSIIYIDSATNGDGVSFAWMSIQG